MGQLGLEICPPLAVRRGLGLEAGGRSKSSGLATLARGLGSVGRVARR